MPVLRVGGELELATAAEFCAAVEAAASGGPRVVVDLRELEFCDSSGLRALMGIARELEVRGGALVLVLDPGSGPDRLCTVAGVREFLRVADSPRGALRLLGAG